MGSMGSALTYKTLPACSLVFHGNRHFHNYHLTRVFETLSPLPGNELIQQKLILALSL